MSALDYHCLTQHTENGVVILTFTEPIGFKNGGTLRIGTDDAENLAGFLEETISG